MKFLQASNDFPMMVGLGEKMPSFGLHRFKQGLRFLPAYDEGFSLRGDKRRLVYKGRRRSHRFTILGDNAFEYDCILNKEPESHVISLLMEGSERFDFFKQPEFVKDPFLKGSYAVYKKETLLGEGTGKLCHIHRPLIIDARGRKVWGELAVIGNILRITIPEQWLAEAKYPVIVDPTIGTTTIGSQNTYTDLDGDKFYDLFIECSVAVNRFLITEAFSGTASGYVYAYEPDYEGPTKPVLYSDNNNVPLTRRSVSEGIIDCEVKAGKPAGWRTASFNANTNIASGTYVWFGFSCYWFSPKFDYGAKCYKNSWDSAGNEIPNTYPVWSSSWYFDLKLSMYFNYTSVQNYIRTLIQGVTMADSRKLAGQYIRPVLQTVKGTAILNAPVSFIRKCLMSAANSMNLFRTRAFARSVIEQAGATGVLQSKRGINRKCENETAVNDVAKKNQGFFRAVAESLPIYINYSFPVLFARNISDSKEVIDTVSQWGVYIRGLYDIADTISSNSRQGEFYRKEDETVQAIGPVFRSLLIFARILTTSLIRDFIIRRFLVAREELVLKSKITRKLTIDSNIN